MSDHQEELLKAIKENNYENMSYVAQYIAADTYENIGYGCKKVGESFIIKNDKMYFSVHKIT